MYQVSDALRDALAYRRKELCIRCGDTKYDVISAKLVSSCCAGENIEIGSVCAAQLTAKLTGQAELLDRVLHVEIGAEVDGQLQYAPLGVFKVTECKAGEHTTEVTAYDAAFYALGGVYVPSETDAPDTVLGVLRDICAQSGLTLADVSGLADQSVSGNLSGHSCREMTGDMAALLGCNAVIDREGKLALRWFRDFGQKVTPDDYYSGRMKLDGEAALMGLMVTRKVTTTETDEEDVTTERETEEAMEAGAGGDIVIENPFATQEAVNAIWERICGLGAYQTGSCCFYGGVLTEPGDIVHITDLSGSTVPVPVMSVTLEFDGGCKTTIESRKKSQTAVTANAHGSVSNALSRMEADIASFKDLSTHNFKAASAVISNLRAEKADVGALSAASAQIERLKSDKADLNELKAARAEIAGLSASKADIDFANVDTGTITEGWIKNLMVQGKLIAQEGMVYYLDAVHVNADAIDTGTLKADRLLLHGDDGLYYQMNMDKLGTARIQAMTQEEQSQLCRTIHADLITAHSITTEQLTAENIQGTGGWINLAKGTFEYRNATTGNGISWDGEHLSIQADSVVFSSGQSAEEMVQGAVDKVDNLEERMNSGEFNGEDATLLYIDSSRGTVFKNSAVSTILSVILYRGSKRITTAEEMKRIYGSGAYIQWSWQRLDEDRFGVISVDDPKLINDGFGLVLTPDDVDVKVTFSCELIM